jgi:hypothetical protein
MVSFFTWFDNGYSPYSTHFAEASQKLIEAPHFFWEGLRTVMHSAFQLFWWSKSKPPDLP